MNKFKRFMTLVGVSLILTSGLTGCSLKRKPNGVTINVFNWGEYIDESILKDFTKKTGIKVNYETYATNEEMYQKVKSGTNDYDLICPSEYMTERMIKEGLLKKIDFKQLPNYKNIDTRYKNLSYDPTNSYSIPYMWGTLGIIYDKKQIKDKIDSWNVLWDKKYKNEIFMSDDMRNSLGVTLKKLGYSLNTKKESELMKAAEELIKQRRIVNPIYIGDQVKDCMRNGEKKIAVIYSGDATVLKGEDPSRFEYVVPKEGTNLWFDTWAIPKTAKHVKETEKFINYLLDAKVNKKNVDYIGYATPNKATYEMLPDNVKNDKTAYPTKKVLSKCEVFIDLGDTTKAYSDAWLDVMTE
jgi:spermidine/putrescine transport system substrate-binding protein